VPGGGPLEFRPLCAGARPQYPTTCACCGLNLQSSERAVSLGEGRVWFRKLWVQAGLSTGFLLRPRERAHRTEVNVAETNSGTRLGTGSLILVPALITLAVTILRVVGELEHWTKLLFNPSAGGGAALIGIAWLPFVFGPYFAVKLVGAGQGPSSKAKAIGLAAAALALTVAGGFVALSPPQSTPKMLMGYLMIALAGALEFPGWSALAKALLAYAYAARIPVVLVMFFAMQGHWGTHYDALPPNYTGPTDFWGLYLHIGVLPQMVSWVVYTLVLGSLFGSIFGALTGRQEVAPQLP